jgi:hypothetical protein
MHQCSLSGFLSAVLPPLGLGFGITVSSLADASSTMDRQLDVIESVGVVRYFHPHDGVTNVDWNRVLHEGFRLADGSGSDEEFAGALVELLAQTGRGNVRVPADEAADDAPFRCDDDPQPLSSLADSAVRSLAGGLVHVVLPKLGDNRLDSEFQRLADARGIIFDLRGYPRGFSPGFLGYFLDAPDDWNDPFRVLLARAPDGDLPVVTESGWGIAKVTPSIDVPVVFLTDHRALSSAESLVGFIQYHQLGPVVGSHTAGANGNVIPLELPGGFTTQYSGLRVVGADGEPFHGRGIAPDVELRPTRQGLREQRDEVLEHAISLFDDETPVDDRD